MSTPYTAPQAPVETAPAPDPGWPGFGRLRRAAIVINAVVLVIIGIALAVLVVQALWTHGGGNSVFYLAGVVLYGGAALTGVLGLWPWRRMGWLRRLMFGWNALLAALLGLLGLGSVAVVAYRNPSDGMIGAVLILLAMLPACSVLVAYRITPGTTPPPAPRPSP